jgi:hypothetical protein
MTADDFNAWLTLMSYSDAEAARELGIGSRNTIAKFRASGAPAYIGLACAARAMSSKPWSHTESSYRLYEARYRMDDGTWSKVWTVRAPDLPEALYRYGALLEDAQSSTIEVRLVPLEDEVDYGHDPQNHFNVFEHSHIRWDRTISRE